MSVNCLMIDKDIYLSKYYLEKKPLIVIQSVVNCRLINFRTGNFIKQTIDVGFVPRQSGTGKGAPGSALTVHPTTSSDSK